MAMRLFRFYKKMQENRNRARGYGRGQGPALEALRRIGQQKVRNNLKSKNETVFRLS